MNIAATSGIPASIAGSPLAQTSGADADRVRTDTAAQHRHQASALNAEKSAGIGETDGNDHQTEDRDADGRRPWEFGPAEPQQVEADTADPTDRKSRDVTGESGGQLDLSG